MKNPSRAFQKILALSREASLGDCELLENKKRQLGTLEGKMSVTFSNNFAMTDEKLI